MLSGDEAVYRIAKEALSLNEKHVLLEKILSCIFYGIAVERCI